MNPSNRYFFLYDLIEKNFYYSKRLTNGQANMQRSVRQYSHNGVIVPIFLEVIGTGENETEAKTKAQELIDSYLKARE